MLEPLLDRIIVEPVKKEDRTESGIILPDTVSEQGQTAEGIVVDVGPGSRNTVSYTHLTLPTILPV